MIGGSCLCGAISFEIDETRILLVNNCYCSKCRKSSGAQYATFLQVRREHFRWLSGQEHVASYESSRGNHRFFCARCGSTAPGHGDLPTMRIPGGLLDADPGVRPEINMCTDDKAEWCAAEAPQTYAGIPPQFFWADFIRKVYDFKP